MSETITVGGGCFWCTEAVFEQLKGATKVESGYSGGKAPDPSYEAVCGGDTGHAEVVQVTFDASIVSFREILQAFFTVHDPTTLNRQGADHGTQYRSVIFTHTAQQEATARDVIAELAKDEVWDDPIVTEVTPFAAFYPAEEYHQRYYERNPYQGYCQAIINPKLAKVRKEYTHLLKQA